MERYEWTVGLPSWAKERRYLKVQINQMPTARWHEADELPDVLDAEVVEVIIPPQPAQLVQPAAVHVGS